MNICVNCKEEPPANQIIYNVTDLDTDILKIVEETIGREAKVNDFLCSYCFSTVIQLNGEDKDDIFKEAEIQDPLSESQKIQVTNYAPSEEEEELEGEHETEVVLEESSAETVESEEEEDLHSSSSEDDPDPVVNLQSKTCVVCYKEFDEKQLSSLPLGPERDTVESRIHPRKLSRHSVICRNCSQTILEKKEEQQVNKNTIDLTKPIVDTRVVESTESTLIYVPNYYVIGGTKKCFVKNCQNRNQNCQRKTVPTYMRRVLLENYNVFLTHTACSCTEHRKEYYRDWSELRDKKLYKHKFNSEQIEEMLEFLRNDL